MINFILALLNVSSLVIPQLRKNIIVIVLLFTATLLALDVMFVESLSYFPIDVSSESVYP
jgi:hypothetical protein